MDRYELKGEIGDGSFGRVMKATLKENGDVVAIKHIKRKFKSWKACVGLREVSSLRNMSHPNIVPIKEVIRERDESLYFVFEYMPGGSLYELTKACIEDRKAGKPEDDGGGRLKKGLIRSYVRQILSGISYIHARGYVHRDIKPENILVNGNICKVADFGLAREVSRGRNDATYYVSTRWYRAPEVILRISYGKPIDLFATGLILAELFSLRPLLPGSSEIDQISRLVNIVGPPTKCWAEGAKKMKRMNFRLSDGPSRGGDSSKGDVGDSEKRAKLAVGKTLPRDAPPVVTEIVCLLISWNPSNRPSADEMLKHEYFRPSEARRNIVSEDPGSKLKNEIALNQSERGRSDKKQDSNGRPEPRQDGHQHKMRAVSMEQTKLEISEKDDHPRHRHKIGEVVAQRRRLGGEKVALDASAGKSEENVPPTNLTAKAPRQPENEFCQYLNALSNSHDTDGGRSDGCQPSGNKIRRMFQGCSDDRDAEPMSNPFRQSLDIVPTPGARRSRIAQATKTSVKIDDVQSSRKGATRRAAMKRRSHGGRERFGRAVERPRWLLSNQNMGKRAMEVSVCRPAPLGIDESNGGFHDQHDKNDRKQPKLGANDPFTCLDTD